MMDRVHCEGCRDDYYNDQAPEGCWNRETAQRSEWLLIGVDEPPPYKKKTVTLPNCYSQSRSIKVKPDALTKDGYWK